MLCSEMSSDLIKTLTVKTYCVKGSLYVDVLLAVKWKDAREVFMLSCKDRAMMVETNTQGGASHTVRQTVKPQADISYNRSKAGVDKSDQMLSYHPFQRKTLKLCKKVISYIFLMGIVNAHKIRYIVGFLVRKFHSKVKYEECAQALFMKESKSFSDDTYVTSMGFNISAYYVGILFLFVCYYSILSVCFVSMYIFPYAQYHIYA